jgi:EAL and modified HD-GYP domain-containing signal transduction protein
MTLRPSRRPRIITPILQLSRLGMVVAECDLKIGEKLGFELTGPGLSYSGIATVAHQGPGATELRVLNWDGQAHRAVRPLAAGAARQDVVLARQPILDRGQVVQGYELLYRHADVDYALVLDDELATARVALNALTEIGLDDLVGTRRAWINVSRLFLLEELALSLPPERIVLELLENQLIDQPLLDALARLREAGYQLAIRGEEQTSAPDGLIAFVDIVKLDLQRLGPAQFGDRAARLKARGLTVVGEKLETHAEVELALAAGCDLLQGYFFCRPRSVSGQQVLPNKLTLLRLAASIQDPDLELADLERVVSVDVALSYRLLRYINSAYFSLRQPVSSIGQALALLGIDHVRQWITLTLAAQIGDKPRELFVTALIRARFCQLAGRPEDGPPAELFALGLFSVVDALTDTPMEEILAQLPFPPRVTEALISHTGPGRLLECLNAIEHGEFDAACELVEQPARHYFDAIAWTYRTSGHLFDSEET